MGSCITLYKEGIFHVQFFEIGEPRNMFCVLVFLSISLYYCFIALLLANILFLHSKC